MEIRQKIDPLRPLSRSLKVTGTDAYRSATYDFLLVFLITTGISRTVSEIKGTIAKFSHSPCI